MIGGLIGLALVIAGQVQTNDVQTSAWANSIVTVAETENVFSLDRYAETADNLADKLARIVATPGGDVTVQNVDRELNIHLIERHPSVPWQAPDPFYTVKAGRDWFFDVIVVESDPHHHASFTFGYLNQKHSSGVCVNIVDFAKRLEEVGFSSLNAKILEPQIMQLEFYKQRVEVHVVYDHDSCMTALTMESYRPASPIS